MQLHEYSGCFDNAVVQLKRFACSRSLVNLCKSNRLRRMDPGVQPGPFCDRHACFLMNDVFVPHVGHRSLLRLLSLLLV